MSRKADAIINLLEAHAERKKCHDSCEYDRGYFCARENERYAEACNELEAAFQTTEAEA